MVKMSLPLSPGAHYDCAIYLKNEEKCNHSRLKSPQMAHTFTLIFFLAHFRRGHEPHKSPALIF